MDNLENNEDKKMDKDDPIKKTYKSGSFIGIGMALGVAYGIIFDNLAIGIALGVAIGVAIDSSMQNRDKKKK